ncbi:hypothetical protein LCGC14_2726480, partial [marine sediment metagenome]
PRHGEGSWQESLKVLAYAPGVWSSYEYAGVAARAARVVRRWDAGGAKVYADSAAAAMKWAERELPRRKDSKDPHAVADARNLAAAELYRLTGERRWHEIFLATTAMTDPKAELFEWKHHEQREAAWVYCRTDRDEADAKIRKTCRAALIREADQRVRWSGRTGFRWTKYPWHPIDWGGFTRPDAIGLARAHVLTGASKYLRAMVLTCQVGLGANPVNLCYTTGLGHESPQHPLHVDSRMLNVPPPAGITVFGPVDPLKHRNYFGQKLVAPYCHPKPEKWPTIEAFWDVFWFPAMCEYTVQNPMANVAYVWGYLAARPRIRN